ncbi:MAG: roadblock/LC7 domain-containing protein [Candidatus Thorarchaeota archaeon]
MKSAQILTKLNELIKEFTDSQSDVQGQIVISFPAGIPIAETWKEKIDPILIGAVCAAMKITFQDLCANLNKGNLKRLFMNSKNGRVIIQNAGPNAILTTLIDEEADLYTVAFNIINQAIKIEYILKAIDFDSLISFEISD